MIRTLSSALVALSLGFAAPAFAQDSQLAAEAQNILDQYGYEVDATQLSEQQLAEFQTFASQDVTDQAAAEQRIDQILVMDAGTSIFVSEEMRAMFDNPTELEQNARQLLDTAGYSEVDVSGLTTEQLAQLWFLQGSDESGTQADLVDRIQVILGES
jgi:hypothetical protein